MAAGGCRGIQYGVESGSQRILDTVKHIKKEQVLAAVKAACSKGIGVACSFMVPFPDDTLETITETGEFMREIAEAPAKVLLNYTCPFAGTYFCEHAEELGLTILADTGRSTTRTCSDGDAKSISRPDPGRCRHNRP